MLFLSNFPTLAIYTGLISTGGSLEALGDMLLRPKGYKNLVFVFLVFVYLFFFGLLDTFGHLRPITSADFT